jgi:hypothetical protein
MGKWLALLMAASSAFAAELSCPLYPREARAAHAQRLGMEHTAESMVKKAGQRRAAVPASINFIDDHIFGRMAEAGIEPAPVATDESFLRRVSIDLTGRIPTPDQVREFLADEAPDKRQQLVRRLIASPGFVDALTLYFGNRFQVTSNYYQLVGIPGRNLFHRYLRDFISEDRPFNQVVTELITASGDTHRSAPGNFLMRGIQQGDPIQDTWDALTNTVTTEFLGVQTQCVSCHDGRRHLEEINLYLVRRRREEFMRLSAFFARMQITEVNVDAFNQQRRGVITDLPNGVYHGIVNANNPGARPARIGSYEPQYMFTEEKPVSGAWRRELARLIVNDRQFARATVNYLWAHLFRVGIVDPPNSWDLMRIDPKNPPPAPWGLQPSHPELLEALADEFIRSGYRIRPLITLMAESAAYQLSSRYEGEWKPEYARYFAKHFPRRLSAEEMHDALVMATMTETPMRVEGFEEPLTYAVQLPDPSEPRANNTILNLLTSLGRGDWWRTPRTTDASVVQALFLMNDNNINQRMFGNRSSYSSTLVARLMTSTEPDEEIVRKIYLATLGRRPSDSEIAIAIRSRRPNREEWLSDVQWALVNKAEFSFNH